MSLVTHTAPQTLHPHVPSVHTVSNSIYCSLAVLDIISRTAHQCPAFIPASCAAIATQCLLVSLVGVAVP